MSLNRRGIISHREFREFEEFRLLEHDFTVGNIYHTMLTLQPNEHNIDAITLPCRLDSIRKDKSGIYVARLAVLHSNFEPRPNQECTAYFTDGYWTSAADSLTADGIAAEQAYLRPSNDELDNELELIVQQAIPVSVPAHAGSVVLV